MKLAIPCDCGALMVVYDRRQVGRSFQYRARCKCGASTKVTYSMEGNFVLLRPRRNALIALRSFDGMIEAKETTNG